MDYEKKYKEALEWARKVMQGKVGFVLDEVLEKFPELKESEDERMRNVAINACKYMVDNFENSTKQYEDAIAWLEKQAEQNPVGKIQLGKKYKCIASPRYSTFMKGKIYKPEDKFLCSLMNFCSDCFEPIEDDEQKSTDKIEPKFKVGDWVINTITNAIEQVIEVTEHDYICSGPLIVSFNDQHLLKRWTIEDAKDGDVLYDNDTNTVFIFKSQACGWIKVYCDFWITKNKFTGTDPADYGRVNEMDFKPATKEQRDLLFQKMKEADYEWDAEKKELKKIEHNPTDEEMKIILQTEYEKGRADAITEVQKPAWSEDDERIINSMIRDFEIIAKGDLGKDCPPNTKTYIPWLKSLKERYTWKKSLATAGLENSLCDIQDGYSDTSYEYRILGEAIEFIRCTEPQPHWKPSKEQMLALEYSLSDYNTIIFEERHETLTSLYQDLKKLREE